MPHRYSVSHLMGSGLTCADTNDALCPADAQLCWNILVFKHGGLVYLHMRNWLFVGGDVTDLTTMSALRSDGLVCLQGGRLIYVRDACTVGFLSAAPCATDIN